MHFGPISNEDMWVQKVVASVRFVDYLHACMPPSLLQ